MQQFTVVRRVPYAWALAVLVFGLAAPAAHANSDKDMRAKIAEETAQAVAELKLEAEKNREDGELAKTGELTRRAPSCAAEVPVRPFLAFGDFADYTPIAGGSFEGALDGWTLENDARAEENLGGGGLGARSLVLPKGSVATTPAVCLTELHPTLRFWATRSGSEGSRLRIEVLYEDLGGSVKTMTIGWLEASSAWAPTEIVPITVNYRAAVAASRTAAVAFRLTVEGDDGIWRLDDFYVDPLKTY